MANVIPCGFCGVQKLISIDQNFSDVVARAADVYNRLFPEPANVCFVTVGDLGKAVDGGGVEAVPGVEIIPVMDGLVSGHVWAGRR